MKKNFTILFLVLYFFSIGNAQQAVPRELYKAMTDYLNDGESFKRNLIGIGKFDTSIQASEVEIGVPIAIYSFKKSIIESNFILTDSTDSVMSLIQPTGNWQFFLRARDKYLFGVQFHCDNANCEWVMTGGDRQDWKEVRDAYPESTGIDPIIIKYGRTNFIHFQQISKNNLTHLTSTFYRNELKKELKKSKEKGFTESNNFLEIDCLLKSSTDSYKKLIDKKNVLSYLNLKTSLTKKHLNTNTELK